MPKSPVSLTPSRPPAAAKPSSKATARAKPPTVKSLRAGLGALGQETRAAAASTARGLAQLGRSTKASGGNLLGGVEKYFVPKAHVAKLVLERVPDKTAAETRALFDWPGDQAQLSTLVASSDAQLAKLSDRALGQAVRPLLDPSLPGKLFGNATERSRQALRLVLAHGTDAGHVDAVLGEIGYLRDAVKLLKGPAATELKALLQANRARPGDWAGFERYLDSATNTEVRPGTKVEPLIDGQKAFPAMYKAIAEAKSSVNVSVFSFESDNTGWDMAKCLASAADRGCKVRLVYDPVGSRETHGVATDANVFKFMTDHGVEVRAQGPGPLGDHLTHRKLTIVDGKTGFIGGMNVGDEYSKTWHDCHAKVTGLGVADLQALFVRQWKADGGSFSALDEARAFPPLTPDGAGGARIIGHEGLLDQNLKLAYLRAIDTSQRTIHIANPYFSDPDIATHLEAAARRGVDVKVVVPATNDQPLAQEAELGYYQELLAAGVHLYQYTGRPMAHDKVATFDGRLSTIGSSNLDARSLSNNDEANVWTSNPEVAEQLDRQLFAVDVGHSRGVTTPEKNPARALVHKLVRTLAPIL